MTWECPCQICVETRDECLKRSQAPFDHELHLTIGYKGAVWVAICPEADLDYRCRRCSVGDYGCALEAVLQDLIDSFDLFPRDVTIQDPSFPIRVKLSMIPEYSAEGMLESLEVIPWTP